MFPVAPFPPEYIPPRHSCGSICSFFLKFLLRAFSTLRISIRTRKQQPSQQIMNARRIGMLFDDRFVFALRVVPFALHLQRFRIQLVRRHRAWRIAAKVLCGARRKIGVCMHKDKKNLWILRKLMPQRSSKIQSRVAAIQRQRAPQPQALRPFFAVPQVPAKLRHASVPGSLPCSAPVQPVQSPFRLSETVRYPDRGVFFGV